MQCPFEVTMTAYSRILRIKMPDTFLRDKEKIVNR